MTAVATPAMSSPVPEAAIRPPRRTSSLTASRSHSNVTRKPSERRIQQAQAKQEALAKQEVQASNSSFLISPSPSPNAERSHSVNGKTTNSSRNTSGRPSPSPRPRSPTPASYPFPRGETTSPTNVVTPVSTPKRKRQNSAPTTSVDDDDTGCVGRFPTMRLYAAAAVRMRKPEVKQVVENVINQTHPKQDDGAISPRTMVSKRMSELGLIERPPLDYWASADSKAALEASKTARRSEALSELYEEPEEDMEERIVNDVRPGLQRSRSMDSKPLPRRPLASKPLPATPAGILEGPQQPLPSTYSLFPNQNPHMSSDSSKASENSAGTNSTLTPATKRRKKSPSPPLGARPVRFSPPPTLTQKPKPSKTSIAVPRGAWNKPKRSRPLSPPMTAGKRNPLVWQDHEITGHLLDDPMDDGYGINGIGFKPTKREEEVRKMKRRMQVDAWRAREGRAEREERFKRRVGNLTGADGGAGSPVLDDHTEVSNENAAKVVRFYEGK